MWLDECVCFCSSVISLIFLDCALSAKPMSPTCRHLAICPFSSGLAHTLFDTMACLDLVVHACIPTVHSHQGITALTHNIAALAGNVASVWPSPRSAELCGHSKLIGSTSVVEKATRKAASFLKGSPGSALSRSSFCVTWGWQSSLEFNSH